MSKPRLIVTGYAQHGKDTVCELLRDMYGFSFESSSRILLTEVIYPQLKDKYNYASEEECYADRAAHRAEWFNLLCEYNKEDKARLGRLIFSKYDIYCGLRNAEELKAIHKQRMFDYLIWVDGSQRKPAEDSSSMTINRYRADYVLDNNGTLDDLKEVIRSDLYPYLTRRSEC